MKSNRSKVRAALLFSLALGAQTSVARSQGLTPREAIEAEYRRDVTKAEKSRLERLAKLAATQDRDESAKTYAELLRSAMNAGLYNDAEPIAERVLAAGETSPEVALLAEMVNLVAEANRGEYARSLESLSTAIYLREAAAKNDPGGKIRRVLSIPARISLVNAYIQRLVRAAQYDVARKALTMIRDSVQEPAIKAVAVERLAQIDLIGKPAPAIAGASIDGKPVSLGDFQGDVVLVVFWASWCLPNAEEADRLRELYATFNAKGFRILGVNLDAIQDGGLAPETVLPNVRRFLIDHNVAWPTVMNGTGAHDFAKAYGVTEIPSNVLIGRDGKVVHLDLVRGNIAASVAAALGR